MSAQETVFFQKLEDCMNKIKWPIVLGAGAVLLVIFMTWGAFGGLSGTMGPGWSMMGSGWGIWSSDPSMSEFAGGMFFLSLCFVAFIAALVLWVVRSGKKKKYALRNCPVCGRKNLTFGWGSCPQCGTSLLPAEPLD